MKHKFFQYATKKTEFWKCQKCRLKLMLNANGYVIRRDKAESKCTGKPK